MPTLTPGDIVRCHDSPKRLKVTEVHANEWSGFVTVKWNEGCKERVAVMPVELLILVREVLTQ